MRRVTIVFITLLMLPLMPASADENPFNFYLEEEVVIHPGETVPFRIAWHNIVGAERHFQINVNQSHSNLTISEIPENWTRVGSGRLGELNINISVDQNSVFETTSFSLDIICQEEPDWQETFEIDVLISKWSNLVFGANDGSSFYVQQNVNFSTAVNFTNNAGYDDIVKVKMETTSNWEYGFIEDVNGDGEIHIDLVEGEYLFIHFWIHVPPVQDGSPLAGTGPNFILQAESSLDRRISSWSFDLEIQTFHNMTIDQTNQNLSLEPGDSGRIEVTVRNNGNIDTYLDAALQLGSITEDRIEQDGWTIALFNAFEFQALSPNESRTLEIGFEAPNENENQIEVELRVRPQAFPQRVSKVSVSSSIDWNRGGTMSLLGNSCSSVEINTTCQKQVKVENTGNFYEEYSLSLVNENGMYFEITPEIFGLSKGETSSDIPLNFTAFSDAEGFSQASAKLELRRADGFLLEAVIIQSTTAPYVYWVWEEAQSAVSNGRLEVAITMRNEGNIVDGLVVRMSSSYYTEMSFIPPNGAITEEGEDNIRSFEVVNCGMGEDFTFRAWANIPDDQGSADEFYLNITAHSRLAEENPFTYSTNSSFDGVVNSDEDDSSIVESFADVISTTWSLLWAWKWIVMAAAISGVMINKSLKDKKARAEEAALFAPLQKVNEEPEDWMAEFANKKQAVPEPAKSPEVPNEVFTGMFQAVSGQTKPSAEPVDSKLVGAASTVLDHHEIIAVKSRLDSLANEIASGEISKPHDSNIALPDDIVPVTDRTVAKPRVEQNAPKMLDLDDLDL